VRVLGVDGAYVRGWGNTQPVLVAVDLGTGEPVMVGYVDEKDPQAVKEFLEPLMQRLGVSVIVTDDLSSYKQAAAALQLEHQICQFHVRRRVGLAVHELNACLPPEWVGVAEEVRQILRDLPIEGDKRLVALSRLFPPSQWGQAECPLIVGQLDCNLPLPFSQFPQPTLGRKLSEIFVDYSLIRVYN